MKPQANSSAGARGPVTLVCFDWGGVILKICRSWEEGCARAGVPVRDGSTSPEARGRRRAIAQAFHVGAMEAADFYRRLSAATEGVYSPAELERIHHAWLIEEYPGIAGVIDELLSVPGVQTGVLSNTNHEHWRRHQPDLCDGLKCFPTIGRLMHRHASHVLRLAKPDAEIYHAFVRQTGHGPGGILFFDDLAENIDAARAAGWNAEQIDHTGDTAAQIRGHLRRYGVM